MEAVGRAFKGGTVIGAIVPGGTVTRNSARVGAVGKDGVVRIDGNVVGEARGLSPTWVAIIFFLFYGPTY